MTFFQSSTSSALHPNTIPSVPPSVWRTKKVTGAVYTTRVVLRGGDKISDDARHHVSRTAGRWCAPCKSWAEWGCGASRYQDEIEPKHRRLSRGICTTVDLRVSAKPYRTHSENAGVINTKRLCTTQGQAPGREIRTDWVDGPPSREEVVWIRRRPRAAVGLILIMTVRTSNFKLFAPL